MEIADVIALLGGIALFLYGMSAMGDGLKRVAGNKLEVILYKLSSNPIKGILLGTGVTAVIQSSSATSVMVVGFVNSGMMKVKQAIGIIMGAIIGTSVTGWILCLNSIGGGGGILSLLSTSNLTGVVAIIGIILKMFSKKSTHKNVADILLGFAILMYGMSAMSSAVSPLRESPVFLNLMTNFTNPLIGILVGLVFTSIIQSASASVGILQALAVTGVISFQIALPMIMGIAIGASVPVLLSAMGASVNGKRTAFVYLLIDTLGAVIWGVVFYTINAFVHFGFMSMIMNMVSIAFLNTLFRLVTVVVLTPFIGLMEKMVSRMFPDDPAALEEQQDMDRLESRFLAHPALAIEQSRLVTNNMADKAKQDLFEAIWLSKGWDEKLFAHVNELESVIDRYEDKLGEYLMKITTAQLDVDQSEEVSKHLHALSDFERISDHAKNIGECYKEIEDKKISFSEQARKELDIMESAIIEISTNAIKAYTTNDLELASLVEPLEEVIDGLCDEMKTHHVERLQQGICTLNQGFVFNDLITNYERVADHCSNIAVAIIEIKKDNYNAHEYLDSLKETKDSEFAHEYALYKDKYNF